MILNSTSAYNNTRTIIEVRSSTVKRSPIIFDGKVAVKTDSAEREGMKHVEDPKALFAEVFAEGQSDVYEIQKKFRISRIFDGENELMGKLANKKRK